jgi:putative DNA primase/helicase
MTLELKTGLSREYRRADYITKLGGCHIDRQMPIPLWSKFLDRVTAQDEELQQYLQRVCGYCLTGVTTEHAMFFLYGTGANGKGVFLNTLRAIWGDYAAVAPMETFIESHNERHPTELAFLRGVRLVIAQETERNQRWAESKIKALTGGDPITARFMRQDFFTFQPQFKLLIAGNHKPSLRGVDEAIRRRLNLIPFTVTIPEGERDPDLFEKLAAERPGILAWATAGCLEWQKVGLKPPDVVRTATDDYLAEEDTIGRWIEECCLVDKQRRTTSSRLYASWKVWTENSGERTGSKKAFGQSLSARGFQAVGSGGGSRGFVGIAVNEGDAY